MGPLCSSVLWPAWNVALRFGPSPGKPARWQDTVCWVAVLCMCVGLALAPDPVPFSGRPECEWQHLALALPRPLRLTSAALGENVSLHLASPVVESTPPQSMALPFPPIHFSLTLHVSFFLFIQSAPFLPPLSSLAPALSVWLLRRMNRGRGRKETGVGKKKMSALRGQAVRLCCHVMLMVSRSGSILHPGDSPPPKC